MADPRHEVPQTVQSLPSIGAILIYLSGKDINWWAAFFGLVFIGAQLVYMFWRWRRDIRIERERQAGLHSRLPDDE